MTALDLEALECTMADCPAKVVVHRLDSLGWLPWCAEHEPLDDALAAELRAAREAVAALRAGLDYAEGERGVLCLGCDLDGGDHREDAEHAKDCARVRVALRAYDAAVSGARAKEGP